MSGEQAVEQLGRGQWLYRKACRLIPGGTQLLSKRPERFLPEGWPTYYSRAKGAEVWDLDGTRYLDMSIMGGGACVLGYADPDVDRAVLEAIHNGSTSTLNCPEEVELAELLCELHPWAHMARFARTGGEAMAMAIRIARAGTGRECIALCGYHGWHDWYLAGNLSDDHALDGHLLPGLSPAGVPRGLTGTIRPFRYHHLEELEAIVSDSKGELAAMVMEPARREGPRPGFLEAVRRLASDCGAVLVFDEITSGWRMSTGGIHLRYGVTPDIAVLAKATGNGYPIAAVIGTSAVMQAAERTFMSSTAWSERIGPVAALATIKKFRRLAVSHRLIEIGQRVQSGWQRAAQRHRLHARISGIPPLSHLEFDYPNELAVSTLFCQWMLEAGFLASVQFYASYAHRDEDLERYLDAVDGVSARLAQAIEEGAVERSLKGPIRQPGFQRLT